MRIGIVCPYSFDVPGGVQFHVRDLAEYLIGQGHHVSVLAPADSETALPAYVVSAGRATAVRYNGSVARLNIGPVAAAKVNRWLDAGEFDVLHLHEPVTPSVSVLALIAADGPIVAHLPHLDGSFAFDAGRLSHHPFESREDRRTHRGQ